MEFRFFVALVLSPDAADQMEVVAAADSADAWERARTSTACRLPDARVVAVFSQEDITRMGMLLAAARALPRRSIAVEL